MLSPNDSYNQTKSELLTLTERWKLSLELGLGNIYFKLYSYSGEGERGCPGSREGGCYGGDSEDSAVMEDTEHQLSRDQAQPLVLLHTELLVWKGVTIPFH